MFRKIYYFLSPEFRFWVRRMVFLPLDILMVVFGKRKQMVPPRGLIYTGSGSYVKIGDDFLKLFIEHAGLKPEHRVLDVGSGIGRIARPLTSYLNETGSYEGFDLVETGVKWCRKNISSRHPNFKFQKVNLYNDLYTSKGSSAKNYKFPYNDNEFDFVVLISVFTHMIPEEVENYVSEVKRVLKKDGKCFATFFLLNEMSVSGMKSGKFDFPVNKGCYRLMDEKVKSANVAYDESYITDELVKNELNLIKLIHGYWSNPKAKEKISFQDIVIFGK